jgi:hypothetical protein
MPQDRRLSKYLWLAALLGLIVTGVLAYLRWHAMPLVAWHALNDADHYELFSLNPRLSGPGFHGHEILGRTLVTDASTQKRLNDALRSGARESNGSIMACFNPRHGIRVTDAGVTTDLAICFECRQVEVFQGGKMIASFPITNSPQPTFDSVLKAAAVPLPPSER